MSQTEADKTSLLKWQHLFSPTFYLQSVPTKWKTCNNCFHLYLIMFSILSYIHTHTHKKVFPFYSKVHLIFPFGLFLSFSLLITAWYPFRDLVSFFFFRYTNNQGFSFLQCLQQSFFPDKQVTFLQTLWSASIDDPNNHISYLLPHMTDRFSVSEV